MSRPGEFQDELDELLRVARRAHRAGMCSDECVFCEREEDDREMDDTENPLGDEISDDLTDDDEES